MARRPGRGRSGLFLAGASVAFGLALLVLHPPSDMRAAQDRVFDAMILALPWPADPGPAVRVVDIGAVDETGAPWDRGDTARLAARLADAGPTVVAWDIVFSGDCAPGPVNRALAAALARGPSVLGFLLADAGPPRRPDLRWPLPKMRPACCGAPQEPRPPAQPSDRQHPPGRWPWPGKVTAGCARRPWG